MYPSISNYINSIMNPHQNLLTLKNIDYVREDTSTNRPQIFVGNFSVVFKVKNTHNNKYYAIKCFCKNEDNRMNRYLYLTEFMKKFNSRYFTMFEYLNNELIVFSKYKKAETYPVLLMDWIEGQTLGSYISLACNQRYEIINNLVIQLENLHKFLKTNNIIHGDLCHDNIIVSNKNNLILVDYDDIYIKSLNYYPPKGLGKSAYQHPERSRLSFSFQIDHFSILVIKISLLAILYIPGLYKKYNTSENIIFDKNDFINPKNSNLIKDIRSVNNEQLNYLLNELEIMLSKW